MDYDIKVLAAFNPKWIRLIIEGKKTIEARKTLPHRGLPFKVYAYETKNDGGRGKVVAEFIVDTFANYEPENDTVVLNDLTTMTEISVSQGTQLTPEELDNYYKGKEGSLWFVKKGTVIEYDKPKELNEFFVKGYCDLHETDNCIEDCKYLNIKHTILWDIYNCKADNVKPLTRPPQSWRYIEEIH